MTEQDLSVLDAIRIAMKAEQKAAAYYADAVRQTTTLGRRLFEQLADFHFNALKARVHLLHEGIHFVDGYVAFHFVDSYGLEGRGLKIGTY